MRSSIQLVHCLLRGILRNSFYLRAIRQLVRSIYISQEICKKMQSGLYSALVSHTFASSFDDTAKILNAFPSFSSSR